MAFRTHQRYDVLGEVSLECDRQFRLKEEGRFSYTPDQVPSLMGLAMLTEEVGEVAREVLALTGDVQESGDIFRLRTELIHVAAIAVAMIMGIDERNGWTRSGPEPDDSPDDNDKPEPHCPCCLNHPDDGCKPR